MQSKIQRKPEWLRKKITPSLNSELATMFKDGHVNTVCEKAMCPNISECFSQKAATFMILGDICARGCGFCAVERGKPKPLDENEPQNVANAVEKLGLKHVIITSSTRDDLSDGGAEHFRKTVDAIKKVDDSIIIELLIPDMQEDEKALKIIANSNVKIIAHNLETVPRLYHVRKGSDYQRSLRVLKKLLDLNPLILTKSGIMLGFGERDEELKSLMGDLLDVGCKYLSIGQYLAPSTHHEPVLEYVAPERFEELKIMGMEMGFEYIKSSPYTRSSYMAHEYLNERD
jgi:lipoyl synthase